MRYRTIEAPSKGVFKDRRSEFYSFAYPVETKNQIKSIRADLKKEYHDAKHHVYAYRLGYDMKEWMMSDDGEPHNSSAPAVFGQIQSYNLTDILIVVVRYFGGKKLGIPGLINAYKQAAKSAVENAEIVEKTACDYVDIFVEWDKINGIMNFAKRKRLDILSMDGVDNGYKISLSIDSSVSEESIKSLLALGCKLL